MTPNEQVIEIVLADGTEEIVTVTSQAEALDFLRQYRRRKGVTVRINPADARQEYFDRAGGRGAVVTAIASLDHLF